MGFLKKLVKDGLSGVTQNASRDVGSILGQAISSRVPQGQAPQAQPAPQPQQQAAAPQAVQPQAPAPRSEGVVENALAGLLGSAERFIDNAGSLIAICPKCQTPAAPNTACEKCGTHVSPSAPAQRAGGVQANTAAGPRKCDNCGAMILGAICEYCSL